MISWATLMIILQTEFDTPALEHIKNMDVML